MDWKKKMQEQESYIEENKITIVAGKDTNLFNSPSGFFKCSNFPYLYIEYEGDFVVSCKVTVDFNEKYDLGGIVIWEDDNKWIKLVHENSENGHPSIVSIVTKEYSDDCNGPEVDGEVWLQISRKGDVFALHYSKDGEEWNLARICHFQMGKTVSVGFSAQCPSGEQCLAVFEDFEIKENNFSNMRAAK